MGVGKTTVCRELLRTLDKCVWLDGDWCWMQDPWIVNDGDYSSSWRTWSSNSLMKVRLRMSGMRSR